MISEEIIKIVVLSLIVSTLSTVIATSIGMILSIFVALKEFKIKKHIIKITETLMSMPPVLMGLIVYMCLSRKGVLGKFKLLYTPTAMIIAQIFLVLPIVFTLSVSIINDKAHEVKKNCIGLGIKKKLNLIILKECKEELFSVIAVGFGRAISEVGAVAMVGGNIRDKTRVMTTYIALETGKGNFDNSVIVGIILLVVSFGVNFIFKKVLTLGGN